MANILKTHPTSLRFNWSKRLMFRITNELAFLISDHDSPPSILPPLVVDELSELGSCCWCGELDFDCIGDGTDDAESDGLEWK